MARALNKALDGMKGRSFVDSELYDEAELR